MYQHIYFSSHLPFLLWPLQIGNTLKPIFAFPCVNIMDENVSKKPFTVLKHVLILYLILIFWRHLVVFLPARAIKALVRRKVKFSNILLNYSKKTNNCLWFQIFMSHYWFLNALWIWNRCTSAVSGLYFALIINFL